MAKKLIKPQKSNKKNQVILYNNESNCGGGCTAINQNGCGGNCRSIQ